MTYEEMFEGCVALNKCCAGFGYCSQCTDGDCGVRINPDETTGCAYANGNPIFTFDPVKLDCCKDGCLMRVEDYMRWNGLCAYTGIGYEE